MKSQATTERQLGSIMIITGTVIGAGILALPIICAKLGFVLGSLLVLFAWLIMTYTALLIAEIALISPFGTSFASMSRRFLGVPGEITAWVTFLVILYAISMAYISAATSAFSQYITFMPKWGLSILFVSIFMLFILFGIKIVDWANRILLSAKLFFLILASSLLITFVHTPYLFFEPLGWTPFFIAMPVIITSFTSHVIVPTITDYLDKDPKAVFRVIIIGSTIPLLLYIAWLIAILGVLPLKGDNISFMNVIFAHKSASSANIGDVLSALSQLISVQIVNLSVNIFTDISVMTSYLSVSLALFHFNVDSYKLHKMQVINKNVVASFLTFIIPLVVVLISNNIFIPALAYVGLSIAILLIIMPILMINKVHKKDGYALNYRISNVKTLQFLALCTGMFIIMIKMWLIFFNG
jgi:amino acid permease